jgi:hypothetical protein
MSSARRLSLLKLALYYDGASVSRSADINYSSEVDTREGGRLARVWVVALDGVTNQ